MRIILRSLFGSRAFAITAIGTIALAIALAATVFAIVDGVLFKPLPFARAAELYNAMGTAGERSGSASLALADVEYLRAVDPRIEVTALALAPGGRFRDRPEMEIGAAEIEPNVFEVLGQFPLVGGFSRDQFSTRSDVTGLRPAIISYRLWRDRLGADPQAIGRTLDFIEGGIVIVGVLPRDFVFPTSNVFIRPDFLVPLVPVPDTPSDRWRRRLTTIVRIPADIPHEQAKARLDAAIAAHAHEGPPRTAIPGPYTATVLSALEQRLGRTERPLFGTAFAGALLLVLLACVSVAGLLTARCRDRARELSVRVALGASRAQLLRLLLGEAVIVALAGAAVGLLIAPSVLAMTLVWLPDRLFLIKPPAIDLRVISFATAASTITMLAVSALSVASVVRPVVARTLAGMQTSTPRARSWATTITLGAQSAIGIALVVAGALALASLVALRAEDPGFDRDGLAVIEVLTPGLAQNNSGPPLQSRYASVISRIEAHPGVTGVATIGTTLLENVYGGGTFAKPAGARNVGAHDVPIGGRFFEVAGLSLVDGRLPTREEVDGGQPIAVVSEQIAEAYWPGQRAVGQELHSPRSKMSVTVIGVVKDARIATQNEETSYGEIYVPATRYPGTRPTVFLFRTTRDAELMAREVALVLNRDVAGVIVQRAESFETALAKSVRLFGFRGILFGVAAAAGLTLLAVGVAGLVAMGVARRVREVGIRLTLGARRTAIDRMIVADHLRPVIAGALTGLIASWWTTKLLAGFLYGFAPHDPRIWATASALLLMVAVMAAWVPARRASAIDPAVILRAE
ncbi:MAG TPA: ABC transporter permease [Vicinamibacterales bacterium]|nr:ABC transporter permease [Vicinamibacterales bacterium]